MSLFYFENHATENMRVLYGEPSDEQMRRCMVAHIENINGFANTLELSLYSGKNYGGVIPFPV